MYKVGFALTLLNIAIMLLAISAVVHYIFTSCLGYYRRHIFPGFLGISGLVISTLVVFGAFVSIGFGIKLLLETSKPGYIDPFRLYYMNLAMCIPTSILMLIMATTIVFWSRSCWSRVCKGTWVRDNTRRSVPNRGTGTPSALLEYEETPIWFACNEFRALWCRKSNFWVRILPLNPKRRPWSYLPAQMEI